MQIIYKNNNYKFLENKSFYIAPHNNIATRLYDQITTKVASKLFRGYIDLVPGENTCTVNEISSDVDYVLICSPNYYTEIVHNIKQTKCFKNKIIFAHETNNFYFTNLLMAYQLLIYRKLIVKYFSLKYIAYISSKFRFYIAAKFNVHLSSNERRLAKLKNTKAPSRAFIIGNGPSLSIADLDKLKDEVTFAANKIYLAFDKTKFRPTYYCVEDYLVYEQNYNDICKSQCSIKLFPNSLLKIKSKLKNAIYFNFIETKFYPELPQCSSDPFNGLYWGSTVVYTMIQLAIYMGIKEIYLLGVDFQFDIPDNAINKNNEIISDGEQNHFHKNYRRAGEKWNLPNLEMQKKSFQSIADFCLKNGVTISNVSRATALDDIKREEFDNVINHS